MRFVQYYFVKELDHILGQYTNHLEEPHPLCSEAAINDKQETLKMSHGEDEKTTFLRCSRRQTFLVVPHIKPPLTQMLTHRYKQDLIRTGTRVDAFRICLLMWCWLAYLHKGTYSHTWMCRGKHYRVIKGSLWSEAEEADRVYHAWATV